MALCVVAAVETFTTPMGFVSTPSAGSDVPPELMPSPERRGKRKTATTLRESRDFTPEMTKYYLWVRCTICMQLLGGYPLKRCLTMLTTKVVQKPFLNVEMTE
eukprot:Opistho-2@24551